MPVGLDLLGPLARRVLGLDPPLVALGAPPLARELARVRHLVLVELVVVHGEVPSSRRGHARGVGGRRIQPISGRPRGPSPRLAARRPRRGLALVRGYVVRVTRVGRRTDVVVPRDARQRVIRGRAIPQFRREPRVWHLLTAGINPREVSVPTAFLASDSGELARIGLPKAPHGLVVHGDCRERRRYTLPAACPISTILENPRCFSRASGSNFLVSSIFVYFVYFSYGYFGSK